MLFDEADSELLKKWIIAKGLKDISDADSDVLADYVLALVKTDEPEAAARANCIDNLRDFLGDRSESVVNDVFTAIRTKAYDPSRPTPKATAPTYRPPRRQSFDPPQVPRKRGFHDWDRDESQSARYQPYEEGDRPLKQARRGARGAFDQRGGRQQFGGTPWLRQPEPMPLPELPPFDPNNPLANMANMIAMSQAMGLTLPDLPAFPKLPLNGVGLRCQDYDNKGFCSRGAQCPFEHGDNALVVPGKDEYDPVLSNILPTRTGVVKTSFGGRGRDGYRGRGGGLSHGGGVPRSEFSQHGSNYDRSNTTIIVEQIPEEYFEEQYVRDFFGYFGNIELVDMRPWKHLAIVKFSDHDSASAAINSPKVVFDNRFVKVYWSNAERVSNPPKASTEAQTWRQAEADVHMQGEEPEIDFDEVTRRQEDAQRKHEEQKKQREEAEKQRHEINAKQKAIAEEKKRLSEALAQKKAKSASATTGATDPDDPKGLRATLARLEAEAREIGLDPEAAMNARDDYNTYSSSPYPYPYRGRGGFRGRYGRRGGYNPHYRGRGGYGAPRGGAVMRLDNRPKSVQVVFTQGTLEDNDEALRQWILFNASDSASMSKHPSRSDALVVSCPERYLAENFKAAASAPGFPLAGKVELSWYMPESTNGTKEGEVNMHSDMPAEGARAAVSDDNYDQDVADDDDRWN